MQYIISTMSICPFGVLQYIYIYICVCVCVCVHARVRVCPFGYDLYILSLICQKTLCFNVLNEVVFVHKKVLTKIRHIDIMVTFNVINYKFSNRYISSLHEVPLIMKNGWMLSSFHYSIHFSSNPQGHN